MGRVVQRDWRDDRIAELEAELASKDAIIVEQAARIAEQDRRIAEQDRRIAALEKQVAQLLGTSGTHDSGTRPSATKDTISSCFKPSPRLSIAATEKAAARCTAAAPHRTVLVRRRAGYG